MVESKRDHKRMFSLWLSSKEHSWLKDKAKEQGETMTNILRKLVQMRIEEDRLEENARQPEQY